MRNLLRRLCELLSDEDVLVALAALVFVIAGAFAGIFRE